MINNSEHIVFFDGVCGVCNKSVDFLLKIDKRKRLKFSALQGNLAQEIIPELASDLSTLVFVSNGTTFIKTRGLLEILKVVGGGWILFYGFRIIPAFIRDFIYNLLVKNRYKILGRKDACRIPTPEERLRFID